MRRLAFVTGAAGFIGRHLCLELSRKGWRVAGLDFSSWAPGEIQRWGLNGWMSAAVSVEALDSLSQTHGEPQAIFHCAGGSSVSFSLDQPRLDFEQTVVSAADVLEFARQRAGRVAVVYPSSAAVYGRASNAPLNEDMSVLPVSPYGVHKLMVEQMCRFFASQWELPVAIIRLFSVFGDGLKKQLLWDACTKAASGNFVFSGTGEEVRDWLHVSDAVALLALAAAKASPECPRINGGTGIGRTVGQLLKSFGQLWTPPQFPEFTGSRRLGDPDAYVADVTKLNEWGFRPKAVLEECLQDYIGWFHRELLE